MNVGRALLFVHFGENKMVETPNAFVIMPFDIEFNSIYEKLIKQSLEEAGYNVTRADSLTDQENILSSIIKGIRTADVIVADLTARNPNVFYELGLCHGLNLPVILIAQSMSDIPFDLRSYRVHVYETHFDKIGKLKEFLRDIGKRHLAGSVLFSNPIKDFSVSSSSPSPTIPQVSTIAIKEQLDTVDPKGLCDFVVDGQHATNDLTDILSKLLKANEIVTNKITKHTASLQMVSNNPTAGSAKRFQKISLLASSDINAFSQKVEAMLPDFEKIVDRLSENYSGFLGLVDPQIEENHESMVELKATITELLAGGKEARKGLRLYRDAAVEIEKKNISRDLTRASRRQAQALGGVISNIERVEAFCNNTLALIDARLDLNA